MNQNQEDPKNCYLISSNTFTKEEIHQDTLDTWNKYLNNDDMSDNFKTIIKELFIPYKISPLKFNLNHEYNKTPSYLQSSFDQYLYIAPSLKRLKQMESDIPLGFPKWFISTFPDVVFWAMSEKNQIILANNIEDDNEGIQLSINSLKKVIEIYQSITKSTIECKLYSLI